LRKAKAERVAGTKGLPTGGDRGHVALGKVLQPVDRSDDHREQDHRRDHRQGHVAHLLPGVGALDVGRLVQLHGHVQQAGQEDDHHVADAPQGQQHQGRLGEAGVVEPQRRRQVQLAQQLIDRAGGGVEQVDEAKRGGHWRRQGRQEEDRAEQAHTAPDLGE
jgi:hypothetical protein